MYNILNNSKTGMSSNQNKIDTISNNIANVGTAGYKKLEVGFLDLYTETLNRESYPLNSKDAITGTGVKTSNIIRNFSQGTLRNTQIRTNLAIDGDGFFRIIRPDKTYAYTRNGEFNIDSLGRLADDSGNILDVKFNNAYNYNNLNLSKGNLSINKSGEVLLDEVKVGDINLYSSIGDNDFLSVGDSLFVPNNEGNVVQVNNSNIMQGYVEMSNVRLETEFTDLIMIQRSFQFNSKGFQAVDDMWSMINNLQSK